MSYQVNASVAHKGDPNVYVAAPNLHRDGPYKWLLVSGVGFCIELKLSAQLFRYMPAHDSWCPFQICLFFRANMII